MWRPSFDEVKGPGYLCFRARDKPVQPLKEQLCYELEQLFSHPCRYTRDTETWKEVFAVSSVRFLPAIVLLVLRVLCAAAQVTVLTFSLLRGWEILYFFTTWTNMLVAVYFVGLSLCSAAAFLVPSRPVNQRLTGENMRLKNSDDVGLLPVPLRLMESVSSVALGASFVTCVVYWSALSPTAEHINHWTSYYEHACFIPLFIMALISRIPYRLQHLWLSIVFAAAYSSLCIIIAFVPLTTWHGRVGYVYNGLNYQKNPIEAWLVTGVFTTVLPPLSYLLFWFVFRFNNPQP